MTERFAQVALPLPLATPYTYRVPETLGDRVVPGARIVVPVRRREMIGLVVAITREAPAVVPKPVLAVPDAEPALSPELLETAAWIAGYYGAPLGLTLKAILPGGMWGESQVIVSLRNGSRIQGGVAGELVAWLERRGGEAAVQTAARALKRPIWDAVERLTRVEAVSLRVQPPDTEAARLTERTLSLAAERPTLLEREGLFKRRPRQRQLYEALESLGGSAPVRHLTEQLGFGDGVVRALVQQGLARIQQTELVRDPFAGSPVTQPPTELTPAQAAALGAIDSLGPGQGALLFGVTGSGKTLVYLEAVRRVLAGGGGAIVLVPEIGLTPQTVSRFRGAFGNDIAVLHSGLSDGERADAWRLLRRGERRVAVGARSAVFAPVGRLGMIVIDEEHEASYKNGETPRYHTRDVAAVRARLEGARLVLGSATPSLETLAHTEQKLALIRLPERIGARPLPPVEITDLRAAPKVGGTGPVAWSVALDSAIVATLARKEQALLLLNRRGWAAFLQC
ncbi:MAG TPA: primosomal protein N', partial [Gemmatimonadales bacterium]